MHKFKLNEEQDCKQYTKKKKTQFHEIKPFNATLQWIKSLNSTKRKFITKPKGIEMTHIQDKHKIL